MKILSDQVSKIHFSNLPGFTQLTKHGVSMSHNLLFIGFLSVLPLMVFLCVLVTCGRAVTSNVEPDQPPPTAQQPMIPKRRSRTQDTLRAEYELSKYQAPIMKYSDGQD